jgi:pyridoxine 5'-phosphate synthase PdxJ
MTSMVKYIIITVVEEVSTSGVNVSWFFIADHSELETAGAVERERVESSRSGTRQHVR